MPVEHYENFPVASLLLPARLRAPVEAIYRFARHADDLADEGDASPQARLDALAQCTAVLDALAQDAPLPAALAGTALADIHRLLAAARASHGIPLAPLAALLDAFSQDVRQPSYASRAEVLDYCTRSANPVGHLMLHLYGASNARNRADADAICTALQLINFCQDIDIDRRKPRRYFPDALLAQYGIDPDTWLNAPPEVLMTPAFRTMMAGETAGCRRLMLSGAALPLRLPGRIGWELRLIVLGGLRILERIEAVDYDVFRHRPVLGRRDAALLAWRAFRYPRLIQVLA